MKKIYAFQFEDATKENIDEYKKIMGKKINFYPEDSEKVIKSKRLLDIINEWIELKEVL